MLLAEEIGQARHPGCGNATEVGAERWKEILTTDGGVLVEYEVPELPITDATPRFRVTLPDGAAYVFARFAEAVRFVVLFERGIDFGPSAD